MPIIIASQGPFGYTPLICLLVPLWVCAPFVLVFLYAYSLLHSRPLGVVPVVILGLGAAVFGYFLFPLEWPDERGFWLVWRFAHLLAVVVFPAVLAWEVTRAGAIACRESQPSAISSRSARGPP